MDIKRLTAASVLLVAMGVGSANAELYTETQGETSTASNGKGTVQDTSDNGAETNANQNKTANESGENDPTPVTYTATPSIAIAESITEATSNGDGTFTATVTLNVQNIGDAYLEGVQVQNPFTKQFPEGVTYTISELASNAQKDGNGVVLTVDPAFNGNDIVNMLAGTDALKPGQKSAITFKLTFNPGSNPGPFDNNSTIAGLFGKTPVNDISDDGLEIDPNGNKVANEEGENDPSKITYAGTSVIGLAKAASVGKSNGDGSFTSTITLTLKNMGNTAVSNVQVADSLSKAWQGMKYTVANVATTGKLPLNSSFDAATNSALLADGATMAPGQTDTITFDITYFPDGRTLVNSATASAKGVKGDISDTSDNGTNPDANDNGNPSEAGENDATPINYASSPQIGLAKRAGETKSNGDGSFTTKMTFVVENIGDIPLTNIVMSDNLKKMFPAQVEFTVANVTASGLTANTAFNGVDNLNVLNMTNYVLGVAAKVEVSFDLTFTPNGAIGPFWNSAVVTGVEVGKTGTAIKEASLSEQPESQPAEFSK